MKPKYLIKIFMRKYKNVGSIILLFSGSKICTESQEMLEAIRTALKQEFRDEDAAERKKLPS